MLIILNHLQISQFCHIFVSSKLKTMGTLSKITLKPLEIGIEPRSRLLYIQQGENVIRMTRDEINNLRKLRNGEFRDSQFAGQILPRNYYELKENGNIVAKSTDGDITNTVLIQKTKKFDDVERIVSFADLNHGNIAWTRDFRGRR